MKNYIDIKVIVWNRYHFAEEANMPVIAQLIQEIGADAVIDDKIGLHTLKLCMTQSNS